MKKFQMHLLVSLFSSLHQAQAACAGMNQSSVPSDPGWFIRICEDAARYCNEQGFVHSSLKAFAIASRLKNLSLTQSLATVRADLQGLEEDILIEMRNHNFVHVDSTLVPYFDNPELLGLGVYHFFEDARPDIVDAGNALCVGLDTAAVFHLMRVVELGLRAFAADLGLGHVSMGEKRKPIPIEYAQWETILNQLSGKIRERVDAIPRSPDKQRAQEFYYSAKEEIEGFRDAWRNHVSHTRRSYNREDVLAVLCHVKRFMEKLVANGIRAPLDR